MSRVTNEQLAHISIHSASQHPSRVVRELVDHIHAQEQELVQVREENQRLQTTCDKWLVADAEQYDVIVGLQKENQRLRGAAKFAIKVIDEFWADPEMRCDDFPEVKRRLQECLAGEQAE